MIMQKKIKKVQLIKEYQIIIDPKQIKILIMLVKVFSNIKKLSPISNLILNNTLNRNIRVQYFSQQSKIDILKTYLEIIPPHQIHNMLEKKQNKLENLIHKAEQLNKRMQVLCRNAQLTPNTQQQKQQKQQQSKDQNPKSNQLIPFQQQYHNTFKQIYKYIKSKSPYVPTSTLSDIIKVVSETNTSLSPQTKEYKEIQTYKRKTYLKIIREFKYKAQSLPLEEVVNFIYQLAKLNINDYEVMKAAQNSIVEEIIHINYPFIRKILWAFTHLDVGSSVLYSHISKTLKVGQYQIAPLQLAQSAYMLSKVNQNAKGGYGIFQIASKHIQTNLSRMKFDELVKASHYMLTQNIGTNQFQFKLQAQIEKKYPDKDKLALSDFITLLKSTSAYYFKFKDKALFNLLKTSTVREAKNTSLEQFEDVVWSWGRLGKGDEQLWQCIQSQIKRRAQYLKPRQIAFFYNAISSTSHTQQQIIKLLQNKFLSLPINNINQHYLIKMLLGMQKQRKYNQQTFLKISQSICDRVEKLSKNQLIAFFKVLNQSDYDYVNKKPIQNIINSFDQAGKRHVLKSIYTLKISQITEILYTYIKFEINNKQLVNQCFFSLSQVVNIPKTCFIKALFCFTIKDNYEKAYKMIVILEELLAYGPIGYFFSPYEFPLLAYSVLHIHYRSKGSILINKQLIKQTKSILKQINPVILNDFVKKGYDQAIKILVQNQRQYSTDQNSYFK